MDILLDNPLATMFGPYFLIFYGFYVFFTLAFFGSAKTRLDQTNLLAVPPIPFEIDPYEIAYLRGGEHEMTRAVVFSLVQKGFAEININDKNGSVKRLNPEKSVSGLSPIEQLALQWLGAERGTGEFFQTKGLSAQLDGYARTFQTQLEMQQILVSDETRNRLTRFKWTAIAAILFLGMYKIGVAVIYGNFNFLGIIVMMAIGSSIAAVIGKQKRVTKLGQVFLDRLQLAFEKLKYQSQAPYIAGERESVPPAKTISSSFSSSVDPLVLSVGVFGSGILVGTVFDNYNEAFRRAQQQNAAGSCGSGCGSSCSSGGGDGGSSCGSGCGGCGGGD